MGVRGCVDFLFACCTVWFDRAQWSRNVLENFGWRLDVGLMYLSYGTIDSILIQAI